MNYSTLRIIDASLNRASEGLRVVEDYARFQLEDAFLSEMSKRLRHELAVAAERLVPSMYRYTARDTEGDVGTKISTPSESDRTDAWDVCTASLKRVEQALRSMEEYGKLIERTFAAACEAIRYQVYTLEKSLETTTASEQALANKHLCVLIDGCADQESFEASVTSLVEAGVDILQLRDKRLTDRDLLKRAQAMVAITRPAGVLAIVNDRADIAAAARADGVHLGQDDLPATDARAIVGPRALIGVSTHAVEQARQAVLDGANYLGVGPTFPSSTKSFDEFPGIDYLNQVTSEIALPTFAIGGITAENLPQVLETGVSRIAVSGAVTGTDDPVAAAKSLKSTMQNQPTATAAG